jgi:hypothetical protein
LNKQEDETNMSAVAAGLEEMLAACLGYVKLDDSAAEAAVCSGDADDKPCPTCGSQVRRYFQFRRLFKKHSSV